MARPTPKILDSYTEDCQLYEVAEAEYVYAVFYEDRPINLRVLADEQVYKYRRTCFIGPGHARHLAMRLNKALATDRFRVVRMQPAEIIE